MECGWSNQQAGIALASCWRAARNFTDRRPDPRLFSGSSFFGSQISGQTPFRVVAQPAIASMEEGAMTPGMCFLSKQAGSKAPAASSRQNRAGDVRFFTHGNMTSWRHFPISKLWRPAAWLISLAGMCRYGPL